MDDAEFPDRPDLPDAGIEHPMTTYGAAVHAAKAWHQALNEPYYVVEIHPADGDTATWHAVTTGEVVHLHTGAADALLHYGIDAAGVEMWWDEPAGGLHLSTTLPATIEDT